MGITTRQGIHYLQFGCTEKLKDARIGEFCASCHACEVRCPRGIDVPRVYEAVRTNELARSTSIALPLREIQELGLMQRYFLDEFDEEVIQRLERSIPRSI